MERDDDLVNMVKEQMEQVGNEERWCEADAHDEHYGGVDEERQCEASATW